MIYLDNAATTNDKPFSVKYAVWKCLSKFNFANPGRSGHKLSIKLAEKIYYARQNIASFFNAPDPANVIFTSGCTESLNLAILGSYKKGKTVLTTLNEHNSTLRPLHELEKNGKIIIKVLPLNSKGIITTDILEKNIDDNVYMLAVNHTSNVTGATCNLSEIGNFCKKHSILLLVDVAQSAGHQKIDFSNYHIDMLAVAGHKGLYGPSGIGALIISNNVSLNPIKFGGTGTNSEQLSSPNTSPEGFEAGTLNSCGILGLDAGVKYVAKHFEKINSNITYLTKYLLDQLTDIKGVHIYTDTHCYNGVVSFNIKDYHSSDVANLLNEQYNIGVRSGLHCAPYIHKHLKTLQTGTVRASLGRTTKKRHVKALLQAVKKIAQN